MLPVSGPTQQIPVGVVVSFDFTRDRELWRWAPDDVTLHLTRTAPVSLDDSFAMVSALGDPDLLEAPTREVTREPLHSRAVLYSCTACSFMGGLSGERALRAAMRAAGAPAAVTTAGALPLALRALHARRVAVVHPYLASIGAQLSRFLEDAGIEVLASRGLGLESRVIGSVDYSTTRDLILAGDHPDAEALFVSCTALPTYDLIEPLEHELGKPVLTANQVGIWAAMAAAGATPVGPGQRLLDAALPTDLVEQISQPDVVG